MTFGVGRHNTVGHNTYNGFDSVVFAWNTAVIAAGGTVTDGDLWAINTFVTNMKLVGLWNLLDNWWFFALSNCSTTAGQIAALIDVRSLRVATQVNAPTWTNSAGPTMDGSTQYINLGTVGSDAGKYSLNSSMFGAYTRVNYAAHAGVDMGASNGTTSYCSNFTLHYSDGTFDMANNDNNGDTGTTAGSPDMWVNTRVASTGAETYNHSGAFWNGGNQTSLAVPTINFCVGGCLDNTGTATQHEPNQYSMAYIGGGLTAAQVATMITIGNNFMKAQGTNVF
jgi:hypothetical protein